MGSCTRRHFLLSTCFLQMLTIIERQVFDFLGYMWVPIFANFLHILFIIFGFYGAYHFRIKHIVTYLLWNILWIGWNAFLICFYLNVGELDRDSDLLNVGTGSVSWFEVNGYGCKPTYSQNLTAAETDPFRPIRPERVDDCLLDYHLVEVIHSGVQAALALLGVIGAILISYIFLDEDDRFDFMNGDAKSPQHTVVHPMYVSYTSIPTSASATMLSNKHTNTTNSNRHPSHQQQMQLQQQQQLEQLQPQLQHQQQLQQQQQTQLQHLEQQQSLTLSQHHHHQPHNQQHHHNYHPTPQQQYHNFNNSNNNNSNSNFNQNTFLIHSNSNSHQNTGGSTRHSHKKRNSQYSQYSGCSNHINNNNNNPNHPNPNHPNPNSNSHSQITPSASKNNTLTQRMYSPKPSAKHPAHCGSPQTPSLATPTSALFDSQKAAYYDDSTAKADQLYTNSNRRHMTPLQHSLSLAAAQTPGSSHENTTSSLSYASLQNSNLNLHHGSHILSAASPLSNSNYSLTSGGGGGGGGNNNNSSSGRFARIHNKPKPPKSPSYSSFITQPAPQGGPGMAVALPHRPDIKYSRMPSSERLSSNLEDGFEEESFNTLGTNDAVTYVPFNKPTPGSLYVGQNNNPSYASLNSYTTTASGPPSGRSPNNNSGPPPPVHMGRDNSQLIRNDNELRSLPTDYGAGDSFKLHGLKSARMPHVSSDVSLSSRSSLMQQSGLPVHPAYSPLAAYRSNPHGGRGPPPTRPTNIPLPTVPVHSFDMPISPSQVTPPPPPAPRPHIFQPRSGHAPYPDLSPEVTERYAMPTQYVPRSPVASRIARRQRQQAQERSHLANPSVNFCDQIRDAPPGYVDNGFGVVRAHSHDRLTASKSDASQHSGTAEAARTTKDAAPHVNRRSGRRQEGGKARPRSYCNSINGGDGVIRGSIVLEGGTPIFKGLNDSNGEYKG